MEKLRNVYFYIDTKAYVANAALKADPEVVERFYQESREALWDIGFGTGKDWAQKGNEMLSIGVMAISGNIRAETIPELEQTLKNRRSFQYTRYNDYGNSFVLTKEEGKDSRRLQPVWWIKECCCKSRMGSRYFILCRSFKNAVPYQVREEKEDAGKRKGEGYPVYAF